MEENLLWFWNSTRKIPFVEISGLSGEKPLSFMSSRDPAGLMGLYLSARETQGLQLRVKKHEQT